MRTSTNTLGWNTTIIVFWLCLAANWTAFGQERGIINNSASPYGRLRTVNLEEVRWTGGFWKDKFELVKDVTIPEMWDYFNGEGNSHWTNFRIAAGEIDGQWSGTSWHDGDFYKWLEAVAYVYLVTRDPALDRRMDEVIEVVGKAQQPDGYLSTRIILERRERFQDSCALQGVCPDGAPASAAEIDPLPRLGQPRRRADDRLDAPSRLLTAEGTHLQTIRQHHDRPA